MQVIDHDDIFGHDLVDKFSHQINEKPQPNTRETEVYWIEKEMKGLRTLTDKSRQDYMVQLLNQIQILI